MTIREVEKAAAGLKAAIAGELHGNRTENALSLISNCANLLYQTNIRYRDEDLEGYIRQIASLPGLGPDRELCAGHMAEERLIFYDGFGLNDRGLAQIYLLALCRCREVWYITDERQKDAIPDILDILGQYGGKAVFLEGRTHLKNIRQLCGIVREIRPKHFFFYGKPDDVTGTAVMYRYGGIMVRYQINLTDHAFWLGAGAIDKCIEFRNYGACISMDYRGIPREKLALIPYYPVIHQERAFQGYPFACGEGRKVIFSGGALYKTNGSGDRYYEVVDSILRNHEDVIFWYAGTGESDKMKEILEKYPDRAYLTAERRDLFQVMKHCYFYLSTYPVAGGLMTQYAAKAGKVPLTLRFDHRDGSLINMEELGILFDTVEDVCREAHRLLEEEAYASQKGKRMISTVITEECFDNAVRDLLDGKTSKFTIRYRPIDTEAFRNLYLENIDRRCLHEMLARKDSTVLLRYEPARFFPGGGTETQEETVPKGKTSSAGNGWGPAYEISVVVVTYRPALEKLLATLRSIVVQRDVALQIVVTDDGSEENYFEEIRMFFAKAGFKDYRLVENRTNRGTVRNKYEGLKAASGKYVKGISPGDRLYRDNTLRDWIDFMEQNGLRWSFSEAVYYQERDGKITPVRVKAHPDDLKPYKKKDADQCRWNYVVLSDISLGAVMLSTRELQLEYCARIADRVFYAEDHIWRMMMFEGLVGGYYQDYTVLYEYGSGMSTSGSRIWEERLRADWEAADRILFEESKKTDAYQRRMMAAYRLNRKKGRLVRLLVKGKLRQKMKEKLWGRMTVDTLPLQRG